jgi:hypothetical protein
MVSFKDYRKYLTIWHRCRFALVQKVKKLNQTSFNKVQKYM